MFGSSLGEHGNWVSTLSGQGFSWVSSSTVIAGVDGGALTPDSNPQFQNKMRMEIIGINVFLRLTAKKD